MDITEIWNNTTLRIIILSLIGLALVIIVILFFIHLMKVKKGMHSKFFWVESFSEKEIAQHKKQENSTQIKGKNINTGTNFGRIGDN